MRLLTPALRTPSGLFTAWLACCVALGVTACKKASPPPPPSAASASAGVGEARPPEHVARPDEHAEVPTGGFRAGSMPGDPGRHPELEPKLLPIELGAYKIDRLPYPNDPNRAPLTAVTREDAMRLCGERGARLCTELEWERACKGTKDERYPTGEGWDPRCAKEPTRCESGYGTLGMGAAIGEWVTSDIAPGTTKALAVVRGAAADAPA